MELMSSLLLCALAALVPLTLGKLPPPQFKINEIKMIGKLPVTRTKLLLNQNSPAVITQNEHSVLAVPQCQHCQKCVEMAIKSRQRENRHVSNLPNVEDPYANDILESYHQYKSFRDKRESDKFEEKSQVNMKPDYNMNKNKAFTVTKYRNGGQVYALKIIEEDLEGADRDNETACRVYTVKKYYPCDVPDGELKMLSGKKKGKRSRKVQTLKHKKIHGRAIHTTEKAKSVPLEAKITKTNADTSQMSENYMTSIEELY